MIVALPGLFSYLFLFIIYSFCYFYSHFRCLICVFIDELIQFGSFGRMRTVSFGIEDLVAFMNVSVNSFTISFKYSLKYAVPVYFC